MSFTRPVAWPGNILTDIICERCQGRTRHEGASTLICLIFVMTSSGVVKVILSFHRDDEGSAFERHRGCVLFDIEKHNSMEIACKHLIEFMGIKQQAEKFGLGGFDLKLFRLEKIGRKAENFAIVTKAQLEMELPFRMGSATSELNGAYFTLSFCLEFCPHAHAG